MTVELLKQRLRSKEESYLRPFRGKNNKGAKHGLGSIIKNNKQVAVGTTVGVINSQQTLRDRRVMYKTNKSKIYITSNQDRTDNIYLEGRGYTI